MTFTERKSNNLDGCIFCSVQLIPTHVIMAFNDKAFPYHYNDVIMGVMAFQITNITIVYSTAYSDDDQRKYQSSASRAFVRGIHRWPVSSPHKGPVTRKCFHLMTWSCYGFAVKRNPVVTSSHRGSVMWCFLPLQCVSYPIWSVSGTILPVSGTVFISFRDRIISFGVCFISFHDRFISFMDCYISLRGRSISFRDCYFSVSGAVLSVSGTVFQLRGLFY